MINFKNVNLTLDNREVLSDMSLSFNDGEIIGIIGPPSSGKSILAKVLGGKTKGYKGDIFHNNKNISKYSQNDMMSNFSYLIHELPQNPDASLLNFLFYYYRKKFKVFSKSCNGLN